MCVGKDQGGCDVTSSTMSRKWVWGHKSTIYFVTLTRPWIPLEKGASHIIASRRNIYSEKEYSASFAQREEIGSEHFELSEWWNKYDWKRGHTKMYKRTETPPMTHPPHSCTWRCRKNFARQPIGAVGSSMLPWQRHVDTRGGGGGGRGWRCKQRWRKEQGRAAEKHRLEKDDTAAV